MQTITRILCPTDFSDTAEKAVGYAEQLAIDAKAELLLFHAFDTPTTWTLSGQEHPRDPKIQEELEKNDYRFSTLAIEIVKSEPFRMRRSSD